MRLLCNDPHQRELVPGIERSPESSDFVHADAEGPGVCRFPISLARYELGREVVWGAHDCVGVASLLKDLGYPEVRQLDALGLLREEHVCRLHVAVQNTRCVHVGQGTSHCR